MAMRKYTDEERDEAADVCAMMASSSVHVGLSCAIDGFYSGAYGLALEAYLHSHAAPWSDIDDARRGDVLAPGHRGEK